MKLWNWLSGKKTIAGALMLFGGAALDQVVVGIWGHDLPWIIKTAATLDWVGMATAGTGLTHKVIKKNGR